MAEDSNCSTSLSNANVGVLQETPHDAVIWHVNETFCPDYAAETGCDVWDDDHVLLPVSKHCLYPQYRSKTERRFANSGDEYVSKWKLIEIAFRVPIASPYDLENAIRSYNYTNPQPNFNNMHKPFEGFSKAESQSFFGQVLPKIVSLALSIREHFKHPIPLLKKGHVHSITLSHIQAACLLANAFLCTYPPPRPDYPKFTFRNLFSSEGSALSVQSVEKLKFIVHYFRRLANDEVREHYVTFARHRLTRKPDWNQFNNALALCKFLSVGTIEDSGPEVLEMDFANSKIGGGVITRGACQEEIRFLISPELIVARLFTERIGDDEAILITGTERFSAFTGYRQTLAWAGDFRDQTPLDSAGRINTQVVAADATHFHDSSLQFQPDFITRELAKALVAFHPAPIMGCKFDANSVTTIATGNWGCGAFRGDPRLKFLIQLMATSVAGRDLLYYTLSDVTLQQALEKMHGFLCDRKVPVCQLFQLVTSYHAERSQTDLYTFIYKQLDN